MDNGGSCGDRLDVVRFQASVWMLKKKGKIKNENRNYIDIGTYYDKFSYFM